MIENVNNNETETLMNEEMTGNLDAAPEVVQPAPPKSEQSRTERNPKDWVSEHFKWSEFTHSSTYPIFRTKPNAKTLNKWLMY